jgi:signal transduction histidine kinase
MIPESFQEGPRVSAMHELLRKHRLLLCFAAVVVPLGVLLALQYRWLAELERVSREANRAGIKSTAVAIAERISYAYARRTFGLFDRVDGEAVAAGRWDEVARAVAKTDLTGVRRVFVVTFDEQSLPWINRYDPERREFRRGGVDDETAAIHVAVAPYRMMNWAGVRLDRTDVEVDNRSREFPMAVQPLTDANRRVRGVVGLIADAEHVRETIVPRTVEKVLAKYWGERSDTLLVAVGPEVDSGIEPLYVSEGWPADGADGPRWDSYAQLPWMFSSNYVVLRNRTASPEEVARSAFATNMTISGLLSLVLIVGLLLAMRATAREKRLSEMKSDFVSNVTHELRTPLASIRVFGEFLGLGRVEDPGRIRRYGEFIESESRRLTQLINNILDFSKIESGAKTYHFETTDVREVVDDVLRTVEVRLRHADARVEWRRPAGEFPVVQADRDALAQVVHNLVDNAVKYSRDDRRVELGTETGARHVRIWVQDRGVGIAREEQDKIFDRFHRVGNSLVHDVRGNGLGLAIVRHVVRAHGGKVTVESTLGHGSRFTIHLPRRQRPARPVRAVERPAVGGPHEAAS